MAFAQNFDPREGEKREMDDRPTPPRPVGVDGEAVVEKQAGTGGTIAYVEAGVIELGGSAGFSIAGDLTTLTFKPSIGWFVADNFQISGLLDLTYASVNAENDAFDSSATTVSALVEPSYHYPLTDSMFVFAGLGAGVQYAEGAGTGFAVVPRIGMNFLVGRSGIFTPALQAGYSTVEADGIGNNTAVLTVEPSFGLTAGYTVMW